MTHRETIVAEAGRFTGWLEAFTGIVAPKRYRRVSVSKIFSAGLDATAERLDDNGLMGVSSYIFEPEAALAFNAEWDARLKADNLEYFHATEWNGGRKQFADRGKWTPEKRTDLALDLVKIVREHFTEAVVVTVNRSLYEECVLDKWRDDVAGGPYTFSLILACHHIATRLKDGAVGSRVLYVVEKGDNGWLQADKFLTRIRDSQRLSDIFSYYNHSFVDKGDIRSNEAADLFAWLWARFINGALTNDHHIPIADIYKELVKDRHFKVDCINYGQFITRTSECWALFGEFFNYDSDHVGNDNEPQQP